MSTSVLSKLPVLPPELQGASRGRVRVEVRRVLLTCHHVEPVSVDLCWWGRRDCDSIPVTKNGVGERAILYDIVTNRDRFVQYLTDAKRLFLRVVAAKKTVGYAAVDRLTRISDGISEETDIVDEEGNHVGDMVCALEYASESANPKVTISSKNRASHSASSLPPIPGRHAAPRMKPAAVDSSTSLDDAHQIQAQRPPSAKAVSFKADAEIRSALAHSKERLRLMSKKPQRHRPRPPPPPPAPLSHAESRLRAPASVSTGAAEADSPLPDIGATAKSRAGGLLPSWNLSTTRLRFVSSVSELIVHVRRVRLTKAALDHISSTRHKKITLANRGSRGGGAVAARRPASATGASLFVSYTIPPSEEEVKFCARRAAASVGTTAGKNEIVFDQRSTHPTVFKPDLLDVWWTSDIVFKVHSRALSQRVPTFIGQARLGMKLLLMDAANSSGKLLKLPVYASQEFCRAEGHDFKSEIVGDLDVTFEFKCGKSFPDVPSGSAASSSIQRGRGLSERPVKDTDSDEHIYDEADDSNAESGPRPRVPLPSGAQSGTTSTVYVLLQVPEGRSFALGSAASQSPPSLFLSCRFFSPHDVAKSGVAWNTTRPFFNMQHCVPFSLDDDFVDRCRENFLVIEVWNFLDADKDGNGEALVGVVMLPLHQFYTSFKIQPRRRITLDGDLPIVSVNDWMPVIDLKTGAEKGQLKINLAAGTERQIAKLVMPGWRPGSKESSNEDEHVYDSVHNDEEEDEEDASIHGGGEGSGTREVESGREEVGEQEVEVAVPEGDYCEGGEEESTFFSCVVRIEEGQNLPHKRSLPSTYLTFASRHPPVVVTDIAHRTTRPKWNFERRVDIAGDVLIDPRRHFILKLWRHLSEDGEDEVDFERDHIVGFVAVDLAPLCLPGFPKISGWYNVMDFVGRCRGQVKVSVTPAEDLTRLAHQRRLRRRISEVSSVADTGEARFVTCGKYAQFPSHLVQYPEQVISPSPVQDEEQMEEGRPLKGGGGGWQPPQLTSLDEALSTHSFLEQKLREMAGTTEQLRERLGTATSTESAPRMAGAPVPPSTDLESMTVDELQTVIEGRLKMLRLQNGAGNDDDDEGERRTRSCHESMEEINLVSSSSETPSARSSPDLSAVSAEIAGVVGTDAAVAGATAANTDIPDLGEIDWARVLRQDRVESASELGQQQSRQGPEGGNPAEDERVGSGGTPPAPLTAKDSAAES